VNLEFGLAMSFGFGVSILLYAIGHQTTPDLVNRISSLRTTTSSPKAQAPRFNPATFASSLNRKLKAANHYRINRALMELPDILDLISVCLSAGDGIYRALSRVVPRATGELANELRKILRAVDFGAALPEEIKKLPLALPHPQFAELASKIALASVRGTPLSQMLIDQSMSARAEIRNRLLQQAGKNETRMLIPLVFLILPVTVLFAIYPSLALLNFNYL
jgi:tight adherence protein C